MPDSIPVDPNAAPESYLSVPSLIRPALTRLGVTTISQLAELDLVKAHQTPGVGASKFNQIERLVEEAQNFLEKNLIGEDENSLVESASFQLNDLLFVPSLLKKTLGDSNITSVTSLLQTEVATLADHTGWGETKLNLLKDLKRLYGRLLTSEFIISAETTFAELVNTTLLPTQQVSKLLVLPCVRGEAVVDVKSQTKLKDFHALLALLRLFIQDKNSDKPSPIPEEFLQHYLIFVPGLLRSVFDRNRIQTIGDLVALSVINMGKRGGWGREKILTVESQQHFYRKFLEKNSPLPQENLLKQEVASDLLPSTRCGNVTIEEFLHLEALPLESQGRKATDEANLRSVLRLFHLRAERQSQDPVNRLSFLTEFPKQAISWRDIPLRLSSRTESFLERHDLNTLADLDQVAASGRVYVMKSQSWLPVVEQRNATHKTLEELRSELYRLNLVGVVDYRFFGGERPESLETLIQQFRADLEDVEWTILSMRASQATLEEVGKTVRLTRERVRQLEKTAYEKGARFQWVAKELLQPLDRALATRMEVTVVEALGITSTKDIINVIVATKLAELSYSFDFAKKIVYLLSSTQLAELKRMLGEYLTDGQFDFGNVPELSLRLLIGAVTSSSVDYPQITAFASNRDLILTQFCCRNLLGNTWLIRRVKSQLTVAGSNGLDFHQINTYGLVDSFEELQELMSEEAVLTTENRLRRPGKIYTDSDEIVAILFHADGPVELSAIVEAMTQPMPQPRIANRLSDRYECVQHARGEYIHIQHLGLSVEDVEEVAEWGADLLAGEESEVEPELLLSLYKDSHYDLNIQNGFQLASIVAKHEDVRRASNSLRLAHRDSFDESVLFLAATHPDLALQWHPKRNGTFTPENVRPASNKVYWWKCELGHEFEASPVYRTRMVESCPGCQQRWNLTKIRHFVASLREHLDSFTAAELYLIFQQSGLLGKGGQAKGFVKALVTGRFPTSELDKFVEGEESLVDDFINDQDLSLEEATPVESDDEEIGTAHEETEETPSLEESDQEPALPKVKTEQTLSLLDSAVVASVDEEAMQFLLASGKAKLWGHAYLDEAEAVQQATNFQGGEYADLVRTEFLEEHKTASTLKIPQGYAFEINGESIRPNLMQKHVAAQVLKYRRYGNWSGTGAGKTLSAILATRVTNARLTVICCPNAVVGTEGSGWAGEICKVFPDSDVQTKTWQPEWERAGSPQYLVLNFEQFQQPDSEPQLRTFLEQQEIDFIVVDEVHYTKQRRVEDMSKRKRLVAAMISVAGEKNAELCVLGMSATPVINNLQEGKSLVELVTGVEHADLKTKPTVSNCMKLHQKLVTLGTRWRPQYSAGLNFQSIDLDCSDWLADIRRLEKSHTPLDLEMILTHVRLPAIIEQLTSGRPTLVYSYYVGGNAERIDQMLYRAISNAGHAVGFYTGTAKDGLEAFKRGKIDVLIGSSAVGTGVDGLQHVCDQLIINVLPWTNAEYEQLLGRIWRQGQTAETVDVIVPVTFAEVQGVRWSYCDSKLQRIHYKKSIADAAVDGVVPEGNLRTPAQAQQDILAWLERLTESGAVTIERRKITVPLSDEPVVVRRRQARYGDFSRMNNTWNHSTSERLNTKLRENPEEWEQYHTLYREARGKWLVVPVEEVIRWCGQREGYEIADFGCGEALLAKAVNDRHIVHSFDHIAIDETVVEGDMKNTPLQDGSVDVAVFCLSLMGVNFTEYIMEARRVLRIDGTLHIWEATSRFKEISTFGSGLEKLGFRTFPAEEKGQFTHIEAKKNATATLPNIKLEF